MKRKVLLLLALLCTITQGAWAQASWEEVYSLTSTTSANWTALDAGSTTGRTLGTAGNTTYYYANSSLSFTNSTAGGSGLTIQGTVYLYVPKGVTVTCTGANGNGQTGGGAGIELTRGNSLYLLGQGTVNATGGRAANGGNGGNGYDAECTYDSSILGGSGGTGGNGGGGAGAGIGTRGATGGSGGSGGQRNGSYGQETTQKGVDGNAGSAGGTAAEMGTLYVVQTFVTLNVSGGSAGSNGTGGSRGKTASQHPGSNVYMASGGGGGGAGGFGGAASNIGTGGPGGGGGGGGAAGNVAWVVYSGTANGYYHAGAYGGKGGQNANGNYAPNGADVELTNPKYADIQAGGLRDKASDYSDDDGWEKGNERHPGGSGAGCGSASTSGSIKRLLATDAEGIYYIYNAADWDGLSALVAEGNTFNGKTVRLTVDISVSEMVGSSENNSFRGIFDGQGHTLTFTKGTASDRYFDKYCAPFCYVNGATIQNLKVTGHIYYLGRFAGGLVAYSDGTTTLTNCHVATVIHDEAYQFTGIHGGIVSWQEGPPSITGCTFTGRLLSTKNSCLCGGFVCWTNNNPISITHSLYAPDTTIPIAQDENDYVDGATFVRADNPTITNSYYTQTIRSSVQGSQAYVFASAPANLGSLVQDYGMLKAYENGLLYDGKYYVAPAAVSLADTETNDVDGIDGYFANVTLTDRTLYRDGAWNTLCLPFDVVLSGSPLDGATARPLSSASISESTLNLQFGAAVDELKAGTPYIIKWESGENIVSPVFSGVTIDATDRSYDNHASGDDRVRFVGTYASRSFSGEDKSILFMGAGNTLYYPLDGATLNAHRAYFKIGEDGAAARQLAAFRISFGEGETTGVIEVKDDSWYSLDGRRLLQQPSRAGVYIYKGKKTVIK